MSSKKPKNKGNAELDNDSSYTGFVVKPNGTRIALGERVFWVWNACDGSKSTQQITEEFQSEFNQYDGDSHQRVKSIIEKLSGVDLVSTDIKN